MATEQDNIARKGAQRERSSTCPKGKNWAQEGENFMKRKEDDRKKGQREGNERNIRKGRSESGRLKRSPARLKKRVTVCVYIYMCLC